MGELVAPGLYRQLVCLSGCFLWPFKMLREIKPRNARTARIVKAREPQQVESRKRVLLLHGGKCPQPVSSVLKTVHTLTKPDSVLLNKKNNDVHPFEDTSSLEFLAQKNDCGVVVFGAHSKKRPNNIIVLRIFDGKVLDMAELLLVLPPDQPEKEQKLQIGVVVAMRSVLAMTTTRKWRMKSRTKSLNDSEYPESEPMELLHLRWRRTESV